MNSDQFFASWGTAEDNLVREYRDNHSDHWHQGLNELRASVPQFNTPGHLESVINSLDADSEELASLESDVQIVIATARLLADRHGRVSEDAVFNACQSPMIMQFVDALLAISGIRD